MIIIDYCGKDSTVCSDFAAGTQAFFELVLSCFGSNDPDALLYAQTIGRFVRCGLNPIDAIGVHLAISNLQCSK